MSNTGDKIEIPYSPNDFLYVSANLPTMNGDVALNCNLPIDMTGITCPSGNKDWLKNVNIGNSSPYNVTISGNSGSVISGNVFLNKCVKKEMCDNKEMSSKLAFQLNKSLEQKQSINDTEEYLQSEYIRTANYVLCIAAAIYIFFKTKASSSP